MKKASLESVSFLQSIDLSWSLIIQSICIRSKKRKENRRINLLLTEPGRIYIEWDAIEKEISPKEKTLLKKQKETTKEV
jgi:hypothetical protein